jgi:hypothetical protein
LMGAKISSPTRNATIKRALIQLFGPQEAVTTRRAAAT